MQLPPISTLALIGAVAVSAGGVATLEIPDLQHDSYTAAAAEIALGTHALATVGEEPTEETGNKEDEQRETSVEQTADGAGERSPTNPEPAADRQTSKQETAEKPKATASSADDHAEEDVDAGFDLDETSGEDGTRSPDGYDAGTVRGLQAPTPLDSPACEEPDCP